MENPIDNKYVQDLNALTRLKLQVCVMTTTPWESSPFRNPATLMNPGKVPLIDCTETNAHQTTIELRRVLFLIALYDNFNAIR